MKRILTAALLIISVTHAFAAKKTELELWNESPVSNVRQQIANQNAGTFSEIPNSQRTVTGVTANVDTGKVQLAIEDKTNYNGSTGKVYTATEIPYKAATVAETWGSRIKRYGKGGVGGIVAGLALDEFIKGIGWVMDDGSKAIMKPNDSVQCKSDGSDCAFAHYLYRTNSSSNVYYSSIADACNAAFGVNTGYTAVEWPVSQQPNSYCRYQTTSGSFTTLGGASVLYSVNSNYSSTAQQSQQPKTVTDQEIQDAIEDYINKNPKSDLTRKLVEAAYRLQDKDGNETNSPKNADPDVNNAAKDGTNATNNVLKSPDPVSTGNTKSIPKVVYNNVTNNYNETSNTTNNDNSTSNSSTTTTEGESETKLAPFCEIAATLCEWLDWTKEEPEKEDDQQDQDIDDQGIFSRTFDTVFSLPASCPPDIPFVLNNPYLQVNDTISLKWLCIIFTFLGYPLVLVSHLTGIWILYETVIRKEMKVN